jgi:flagellar biosynthesis protein FliR
MTESLIFSFAMVFIRCSAMMFSSPMFGSAKIPVMIRIFATMALSGALTLVLQPNIGKPPTDMYGLVSTALQEAVAGLLIGSFMSLALQMAEIAGGIMDHQLGLSMSQVLNPVDGVSVTILAQFKQMLAVVILFASNGHHTMLEAFVRSYDHMPSLSAGAMTSNLAELIGGVSLLALQVAAPVLGVSLIIDAAMGIVNKASPQMQVFVVGLPAKIGVGLFAVAVTLPALVGAVNSSVGLALKALAGALRI